MAHVAERCACPVILQLGDFGYWAHVDEGEAYLDAVNEQMKLYDLRLYWIDGNHENHTLLRERIDNGTYRPVETPFFTVRTCVQYVPRGARWTWDERSFVALGGAYSIDKNRRSAGWSWWPEETISIREANLTGNGGPAEVMVTHDCPLEVPGTLPGNKDNFRPSVANRELLGQVVEAVAPKLLVHGHYHHPNTSTFHHRGGRTRVEGFGKDEDLLGAWGVLNTRNLGVWRPKLEDVTELGVRALYREALEYAYRGASS